MIRSLSWWSESTSSGCFDPENLAALQINRSGSFGFPTVHELCSAFAVFTALQSEGGFPAMLNQQGNPDRFQEGDLTN